MPQEINIQRTHYKILTATIDFPKEDGTVSSNLIKCSQSSTVTYNEEELKMHKGFYEKRLIEINEQLAEIEKLKV